MIKIFILVLLLRLIPAAHATKENADKKAMEIHNKALTVDTHVDTPMAILNQGLDMAKRNVSPQSRVDFIRMQEGGLDAIFFAAFTGQSERTPENTEEAYRVAHQMINATYAACTKYPQLAQIATSAADAAQLKEEGKRAIYLGMENGFPLGTDIRRVKEFYDRGVRYITLSHSKNNDICDSSSDTKGPEHNGLSEFGRKVVREMNRLGMMVDVSHISDKAFFDVISVSKAPVIASHSSVRAIAGHHRNMTDDMIKTLAENGGVIQICLLDDYIKDPDPTTEHYKKVQELRKIYNSEFENMSDKEQQAFRELWRETREKYPKALPTVKDLVDHIDHVKNLVGIDYVGIGSDFDGGGGLEDCQDVSQFPNITREMLKRGYSENEIIKVWGGNFFRVYREVEHLAIN
jgi:membrane dipeptidase